MDAETFLSLLEVEKHGDYYFAAIRQDGSCWMSQGDTAKEAIADLKSFMDDLEEVKRPKRKAPPMTITDKPMWTHKGF